MRKKRIVRRYLFFPLLRRKVISRKTKAMSNQQALQQPEPNIAIDSPLASIPAELDPYAKMLNALPQVLTSLPQNAITRTVKPTPEKTSRYAWGKAVYLSYQHPKFGANTTSPSDA